MPEQSAPGAELQLPPAQPSEADLRLDLFLASHLGGGRAHAQRMVRSGLVSVGGLLVLRPSHPVRPGDVVSVGPEERPSVPEAPAGDLRVLYEDEFLAVVDKPAGMVVHPGPGHPEGTLAQLVQAWGGPWSLAGGGERAGIVHRLDRGTSGLLVLARTEEAHRHLARQLRTRTMGREYWALVEGGVREERGRIEAALGRDPTRPRRMGVGAAGRQAVTEFSVLERLPQHTALRLRLLTGRTHQIRVHLAYIGRPVVGDKLYGASGKEDAPRPALHAAMLHLLHPQDGREMAFVSPLPADLEALRLQVGATPGSRASWPWQALP
ncbi:MAG: RluA family pseudouridine synthase [Candidatus Dormiibacterota bacterium]